MESELQKLQNENRQLRLEITAIRELDSALPFPLRLILKMFDRLANVDYTKLN